MNTVFKKIVIGLFSAFIFVNFVVNINLFGNALKTSIDQKADFTQTVGYIQQEYISNFKSKNFYINLNGLFARATGKVVHNDTVRLNNGMLTHGRLSSQKIKEQVNSIKELNAYLEENGIPFLYVQAPYKMDDKKSLLPNGVTNLAIENVDELLRGLDKNDINYLDLRPYTSKTVEMVEKYFYKTDHHWNTTGAFVAFQTVCDKLQEMFPDEIIVGEKTHERSWGIEKYEDIFLGSQGKRVGVFFGGTDDFLYYYPKFETDMATYLKKYNIYKNGSFEDVLTKKEYLDKPNYFNENTYVTYIGGDYPLYQHINYNSTSNLKILIIKDSFSLPFQSFLSSIFSEIDVIDPRHFTDFSVAEYISESKPDVVLMLINPTVIGNSAYTDFDIPSKRELGDIVTTHIIEDKTVEIQEKESSYNYIVLCDSLQEGSRYTLSVEDIECVTGKVNGVSVALCDEINKSYLDCNIIDYRLIKKKGKWSWTFVTPENSNGPLKLLMYAGETGKTQNIGLKAYNVNLEKSKKNITVVEQAVVKNKSVKIEAEKNFEYTIVAQQLGLETEYHFSIDDINLQTNKSNIVNLSVYDNATKRHVLTKSLDLTVDETYEWEFTTPSNGENLQLLAYAGEVGNTSNNVIEFIDMNLVCIKTVDN